MAFRWQQIADTITSMIANGSYPRGSRLPTEAALADSFGVNRHTVRRAVAALRDTGLVQPRQGAGVFVIGQPRTYRLGTRTRFSQNIDGRGSQMTMTLLSIINRRASDSEYDRFEVDRPKTLQVTVAFGIRSLEQEPVSLFYSRIPTAIAPEFGAALHEHGSITRALRACGIPDYIRKSTSLMAVVADAAQARHLHCQPGDPLLRSDSVDALADGRIVEVGTSWFRGDSIRLLVD